VSRPHPFDLAFGSIAESRFPDIVGDAERQRRDLDDVAQFAACATVQRLLQEIESPELVERMPTAGVEYLHALYVGFRFWRAGRVTVAAPLEHLLARLADPTPVTTLPDIPSGAIYFQLPERLFWAQVDSDAPHEPMDGLFFAAGLHDAWTVLAVLGLRPERSGFSQLTLTAAGEEVLAAPTMARTPPFAPVLDGGDSAGLYSVCTAAELLHLALLAVVGTGK